MLHVDMLRMVNNCKTYNDPSSPYYECAENPREPMCILLRLARSCSHHSRCSRRSCKFPWCFVGVVSLSVSLLISDLPDLLRVRKPNLALFSNKASDYK